MLILGYLSSARSVRLALMVFMTFLTIIVPMSFEYFDQYDYERSALENRRQVE